MTTKIRRRDRATQRPAIRNAKQSPSQPSSVTEEQRKRARRLLATEIAFISHPSHSLGESEFLPQLRQVLPGEQVPRQKQRPRTSHPICLGETTLLTAEQEQRLFHRMNYLKYRANSLRATLDSDAPDVATLEAAERLLDEACSIRNQIVQANSRLVMSVVKKFVNSKHTFDELLSDGLISLLKAVERFDVSRGFRFSTYAYRALTRNTYRLIQQRYQRERQRVPWCDTMRELGDDRHASLDESTWNSLTKAISRLLGHLNPRERLIVSGRFGLGHEDQQRTYQSLADELGISKERARQIEQRAFVKLREIAAEMELEKSLEAALDGTR